MVMTSTMSAMTETCWWWQWVKQNHVTPKVTINNGIKTFVSGVARGGTRHSAPGIQYLSLALLLMVAAPENLPADIPCWPPAHPSMTMTTSTSCSNNSTDGKLLRTFGELPGYWVVDAWFSCVPCKHLSFQLYLYLACQHWHGDYSNIILPRVSCHNLPCFTRPDKEQWNVATVCCQANAESLPWLKLQRSC